MTERELLAQYVHTGDEEAFRRLVTTHIDFVYSSAKRRVHNSHLAQDVVQTVFMVLAKKASTIPANVALAGWLFTVTRYAAADALRSDRRRRRYEREAAQMAEALHDSGTDWEQLAPHLENGLTHLAGGERDAVLLRYFQGKSMRETAAVLGITEDAAAKRVSRALERLRAFFGSRGIAIPAIAIASTVAARAVEAAPAGLAASVSSTAIAATTGTAVAAHMATASSHVIRAMYLAKAKVVATIISSIIGAGAVAAIIAQSRFAAPVPPSALPAADLRGNWGPEWNGIPIAPGWPVALPGVVTGTPAVADLDGDGKLEIVVPAMHRPGRQLTHPNPTTAAVLFAFRADGTPMKGWPIVLLDERGRAIDREQRPAYADNWAASPSVADLDGDGRDEIVITAPPTHTFVINGDGSRRLFPKGLPGGEVWSSFPIIDLDGDGQLDLICGDIAITAAGKPTPDWTPPLMKDGHRSMFGFAPCVGDSNGDGQLEIYYGEFRPGGFVHGLDHTGREIPGWPQFVIDQCLFPPVMGDVNGDGQMEIFAVDGGGHLMGWTWNGRPLLSGIAADGMTGIFKADLPPYSPSPTLADLDGDGRAEIILFDQRTRSLKAWRGDGTGLLSADGAIVHLPEAQCSGGVSVGDLGGDGTLDLFVATYWVQLARDGNTTVVNMLPQTAETTSQPTIADIDRDGKADIVFALTDGRVFVYRTGMDYNESWMQWPTANGNQRHTGVWRRPPAK